MECVCVPVVCECMCMGGMYRIFLFDHRINVEDRLSGMKSGVMIFFVISKKQRQTVLMFVSVGTLPPQHGCVFDSHLPALRILFLPIC